MRACFAVRLSSTVEVLVFAFPAFFNLWEFFAFSILSSSFIFSLANFCWRRAKLLKRVLTPSGALPGSFFAIADHELPQVSCKSRRILSSDAFQGSRDIVGLIKFAQRSRICLTVRKLDPCPLSDADSDKELESEKLLESQFSATFGQSCPNSPTSFTSNWSSSVVQRPLASPGRSDFDQRCWHCVWFRVLTSSATAFQCLRPPYFATAFRKSASSSRLHSRTPVSRIFEAGWSPT
jgi:hypothetical protein